MDKHNIMISTYTCSPCIPVLVCFYVGLWRESFRQFAFVVVVWLTCKNKLCKRSFLRITYIEIHSLEGSAAHVYMHTRTI